MSIEQTAEQALFFNQYLLIFEARPNKLVVVALLWYSVIFFEQF